VICWLFGLWCLDHPGCDVLTIWIAMSCLSGLWYRDYSGCDDLQAYVTLAGFDYSVYVLWWTCSQRFSNHLALKYFGFERTWWRLLWYRDYSGCDDLSIQTVMCWLFGLWCLDLLGCYVMSVWVVMFCDVQTDIISLFQESRHDNRNRRNITIQKIKIP
jgi:hypothetical protein